MVKRERAILGLSFQDTPVAMLLLLFLFIFITPKKIVDVVLSFIYSYRILFN